MISWEVLGISPFMGRVIFISKFQRKKEECRFFLFVERSLNFFTRTVGESLKHIKAQRQVTRVRNGHGGAQMETGDE